MPNLPKIGDVIYVGTSLFIDHGYDDFAGGKATVAKIDRATFITIKERPGWRYNWDILATKQGEYKVRFGDQYACAWPDVSPKEASDENAEIERETTPGR